MVNNRGVLGQGLYGSNCGKEMFYSLLFYSIELLNHTMLKLK